MMTKITDVAAYMNELGGKARTASRRLAAASTAEKNAALNAIADELDASRDALMVENRKDLEAGTAKGLDAALLDRLELTPARIDSMIEGLRQIAALPDPIGEIFDMNYRPSGHPGGTDAGSARGCRHHLRVAPQRHCRRRCTLPQVG